MRTIPREYQIPITWEVHGEMLIETDDIENLIKDIEAGHLVLPEIDSDVDGSIQVDYELLEEMNPGLKLSPEPK